MNPYKRRKSVLWAVLSLLVIAAMVASCAPAAEPTSPPATEAPEAEEPTEPPVVEETEEPMVEETEAPVEETEAPEVGEPVTVSFAFWGDPEAIFWTRVKEEFEAANPGVTIEYQVVPSEEIFDKLLTQIAAGNPPDSAYISDWMTGAFALNDGLAPLDDYIAGSSVINLDDYVPAFLQPARTNDIQYGLPFASETTGLFYRTDRFEEAGLDPNSPPQTWEEFQEYAEMLTNPAENKYGYAVFAPEAAYYFYPWLWQAGGEQLNPEDPNDVIWDSPEGQRAADFYANLANYSPQDLLNATSWDGRVPFANGDVAMYMAGAWFAGVLLTEFPDATGLWAAAPLPTDERCATTIAGDHLVVFANSPNKDAAYKWIEFLSQDENMIEYNLGTPDYPSTLLPPRQSLLENPDLIEGRPYMEGFLDNMDCAFVPEADQPRYFEVEEILTEQLGRAFYGEIDGATAVIEAAAEGEAVLAEE
jgi:multiple sugar transport system substrate-binding protein